MNYILTADGDKLPCDHTGKVVDAHNPANWLCYADAEASGLPVAFVLTANDPFFFVDLDKCLDQMTGQWTAEATAIFSAFNGAWGEVSQSGTGLHILGKCDPSQLQDRKHKWAGWLEFYTEGRFIAFGQGWNPIGGALNLDLDWTPTLRYLVPERTVLGELPEGRDPAYTGPDDDDELISRMLSSSGGAAAAFGGKATVRQLWEADPVLCRLYPDYNGDPNSFDHSSADAALMAHLAFWTGKDMPRMDRLFRRSALMREKYERRDDYRNKTVGDAARMCSRVYDRPRRQDNPFPTVPAATSDTENAVVAPEVYMGIHEMIEHFKGCVYIADQHRMLTPDGALYKPEQFKAFYGGSIFQMNPDGTQPEKNAFIAFTENRTHRFPKVKYGIFDPNKEPGEVDGDSVNTFSPDPVEMVQGDVTPYLDFLQRILPNQRDREILLAYSAAVVQNRGVKFRWAPVLQGAEGNGKTFVAECIAHAVGLNHVHRPRAKEMGEKFNSFLERSLFVIVEEIHMGDRREMLDDLKDKITNDYIEIRGMQQEKRMARNYTNWLFCTNHQDAIIKSRNDRRYAIFFTAQQSAADIEAAGMGGQYFPNLYNWAKAGGYSAVAHYLMHYQIPDHLNPATSCHRAPDTSTTDEAIAKSIGGIEAEVLEAAANGTLGFRNGMLSSRMLDKLIKERGLRLATNKRKAMLESLGYRDVGRAKMALVWEDNLRPTIYMHSSVQPEVDVTDQYLRAQGYVV
jgi:hypothetical protein